MIGNRQWDNPNDYQQKAGLDQPVVYEIRIKGYLGSQWQDWFEGLTITPEEYGLTLLSGPVVDQAALFGLLRKVRDLGMPLFSVNRVKSGQADESNIKK